MIRQIWFARATLLLSFAYSAALVLLPQSIEFFRIVLTESSAYERTINLAWPSIVASLGFIVAMRLTSPEAGAIQARVLAVIVAVLPYLAVIAGTWLASVRLEEAREAWKNLALVMLAFAALSALIALALFMPATMEKLERTVRRSHAAAVVSGLALLVFVGLAMAPLLAGGPAVVGFSQVLGPLGILAAFFAILSLVLSGLVLATRDTRIPGLTLLVLVAAALALTGRTDNHALRISEESAVDKIHVLDVSKLKDWLAKRTDRESYAGKPYPVFIVAAQGGGIYAAYHAASVLAEIQEQWPEFSQHLFAVSSVSGGSLGSAFNLALTRALKSTPDRTCKGQPLKARPLVDRFFSNDFLSPLLYMALFPDFAQRFWVQGVPKFDRALGLEYAFEEAWNDLSRDLTQECGWKDDNAFVKGNAFESWISDLRWTQDGDAPILFLNATHEESGRPVVVSTVRKTKGMTSIWDMGFEKDLRLSTAAVLSARFPYVTPFGWFEGEQLNWYGRPVPLRVHLGDGGYFDNSGAELLTNLSLIVKNLAIRAKADIDVYAIIIGDAGFAAENFIASLRDLDGPQTPEPVAQLIRSRLLSFKVEEEPIGSTAILSEAWAPISTLMGGREFRSKESVKSLLRVNGVDVWDYGAQPESNPDYTIFNRYGLVFPLGSKTQDMPLGWLLSRYTRSRLALRVGVADDCYAGDYAIARLNVVDKLGEFIEKHSEDLPAAIDNYAANCSLKRLLWLRDAN